MIPSSLNLFSDRVCFPTKLCCYLMAPLLFVGVAKEPQNPRNVASVPLPFGIGLADNKGLLKFRATTSKYSFLGKDKRVLWVSRTLPRRPCAFS
jgi:hypothetical protein